MSEKGAVKRTKEEMACETPEEKRARTNGYAYAHWLRTKCKGTGRFKAPPKKKGQDRRCGRYKSTYYCWLFPLVGEPITLGPFQSASTAMNKRIKGIKELIAAGNARQFDIDWLYRYENNLPQ